MKFVSKIHFPSNETHFASHTSTLSAETAGKCTQLHIKPACHFKQQSSYVMSPKRDPSKTKYVIIKTTKSSTPQICMNAHNSLFSLSLGFESEAVTR